MMPTSQSLIVRTARGDQGAFEELHSRFQGLVRAIAMRVLGASADADDVCQEVFFALWRDAGRYDPSRASPQTWIGLIARRRAVDCLRSKLRHKTAAVDESIREPSLCRDGLERYARSEDLARAQAAMARLPEAHRAALSLVYFGGMTGAEVAQAQQVPRAAVKTRLWRGIQRLKVQLEHDAA